MKSEDKVDISQENNEAKQKALNLLEEICSTQSSSFSKLYSTDRNSAILVTNKVIDALMLAGWDGMTAQVNEAISKELKLWYDIREELKRLTNADVFVNKFNQLNKPFKEAYIKELQKNVSDSGISFGKMVENLNEKAKEFYGEKFTQMEQEIRDLKYKLQIKNSVSSSNALDAKALKILGEEIRKLHKENPSSIVKFVEGHFGIVKEKDK
jgi:hypothetical protein